MINWFRNYFFKFSSEKGLTLIDILVTVGLIIFTTVMVLRNSLSSSFNLERIANVMASDIRIAQSLATSTHQYKGSLDVVPVNRCGYGITNKPDDSSNPDNDRKYAIYAGPATVNSDGSPEDCSFRNYPSAEGQQADYPFYKNAVLDTRVKLDISPEFKDIFFEPPDPVTYIDDSNIPSDPNDPTTYYEKITIKENNVPDGGGPGSCKKGSPQCIYICVYYSGRVEITKNFNCPAPY